MDKMLLRIITPTMNKSFGGEPVHGGRQKRDNFMFVLNAPLSTQTLDSNLFYPRTISYKRSSKS